MPNDNANESSRQWPLLRLRTHLPVGCLHARPAASLARMAQQFASDIQISCENGEANAKSLLDILSLAPEPGSEILLSAKGADAQAALQALENLLQARET